MLYLPSIKLSLRFSDIEVWKLTKKLYIQS